MLKLVLCLSCVAFASAGPVGDFPSGFLGDGTNANDFIDSILAAVKETYGAQLEPFILPNKTFQFDEKIGDIRLKGGVTLHDGLIEGLSSLHRSRDAVIDNKNNKMIARVPIALDKLHAKYDGHLFFLIFEHDLSLDIRVGDLFIDIGIALAGGKPELLEFQVEELQNVVINIHGLEPFDNLVDYLGEAIVKVFNQQVKDLASDVIAKLIRDILNNMKYADFVKNHY